MELGAPNPVRSWTSLGRCVLALVLACRPGAASAQTAAYDVDLFQGPLLAPIRAMALGGAYGGYGEDIAGLPSNAATPAVRELSAFRHIEVDARASFSIPIDLFENNDFDNSGDLDDDISDFVYLTAGGILQVGPFGAGVLGELSRYDLARGDSGETTPVTLARYRANVAASFVRGALAVGAGARAVTAALGTSGSDLVYAGVAPELGLLARPAPVPVRFGLTYRLPVSARPLFDRSRAKDHVRLPRALVQPWELEVGLAFQIGPRPLNLPFDDPEDEDDPLEHVVERARRERALLRERLAHERRMGGEHAGQDRELQLDALDEIEDRWLAERAAWALERRDDRFAELPRERVLVLLSLLVSGQVEQGVSLASFLAHEAEVGEPLKVGSSGASTNFSPRFGLEAEPVADWVVLRAGTYYEPNRFAEVGRQHFTFGAAVRMFSTSWFGLFPEQPYALELGMDAAPRYESVSASIAFFR